MLIANAVKVVAGLVIAGCALQNGASALVILAAYSLAAGVGAAIYSTIAGILSQLFGPQMLVKANGLMEASTIVAILTGVLAGAWLADHSLSGALVAITVRLHHCSRLDPADSQATGRTFAGSFQPRHPAHRFHQAFATLFREPWARLSLIGTSLFWGSGATLRLLLFAWVPFALGYADAQTPGNLMGAISIGIVVGASLAGKWVSLDTVGRALGGGLLLEVAGSATRERNQSVGRCRIAGGDGRGGRLLRRATQCHPAGTRPSFGRRGQCYRSTEFRRKPGQFLARASTAGPMHC